MGYEILIINLLLLVVSVAMQASAKPRISVSTPEAGKLDTPRAEEGTPISVVFGTVIKKNPNCVWFGDSSTIPITKSGGGGK